MKRLAPIGYQYELKVCPSQRKFARSIEQAEDILAQPDTLRWSAACLFRAHNHDTGEGRSGKDRRDTPGICCLIVQHHVEVIMLLPSKRQRLIMLRSRIPERIPHLLNVVDPMISRNYAIRHDRLVQEALMKIFELNEEFNDWEKFKLRRTTT